MPATTKEEETRARLQRIKDALEEAHRLAAEKRPAEALQSWRTCGDIIDLYQDCPDFRNSGEPGLKALLKQAQQLLDQLARREQER
jgi:hypothetical protein